MAQEIHSFGYESDVSGIRELASGIKSYHDSTAYTLIDSTGLGTAAAAQTAAAILNIGRYQQNMFWIDSTASPARGDNTGLTVIMETRPASGSPWTIFRTETAVNESGLTPLQVIGSGIAETTGVTHFEDIRITVDNLTNGSGSATIVGYMVQRTPN